MDIRQIIDDDIKANGSNAITGPILNTVLNSVVTYTDDADSKNNGLIAKTLLSSDGVTVSDAYLKDKTLLTLIGESVILQLGTHFDKPKSSDTLTMTGINELIVGHAYTPIFSVE